MRSALRKLSASLLILLGMSAASLAQLPGVTPLGSPSRITSPGGYGSIMIYLRTEEGQRLPDDALPTITVSSPASNTQLTNQPQRTGDGWAITGLLVGNDYQIQVRANGYQVAVQGVDIPDVTGAVSSVIIFLKSVDQALVFRPPTGGFVLAPKAQKEVQHALQDLQQGKIPSAQKHIEKALQLAPGNPYLEKSVSIDPKQPAALMALGALRFQQGEDEAAIQVLTKAVQLDATSWKAEWYLACSYLRQKQFEESRVHAEQALKLGKEKARLAEIILGEAQANLGQSEKAAATFETFARENPQNPNAQDALRWADMLRHPPPVKPKPAGKTVEGVSGASEVLSMSLPLPPPVEVPPRDWAPPDIDAEKPFVISGATCPLAEILKTAETNALTLVTTLQEFSATEDFQAVEEKKSGALERPASKTFNYYVFIEQPGPGLVTVREVRDDTEGADALLGRVADAGGPALALVFHPTSQKNFDWKCEGLGKWNDRSAWIVHFTQDTSRTTSWQMSFGTPSRTYPLPLKGRAWLSENGGQVLHMETDLVEPMAPLDLRR